MDIIILADAIDNQRAGVHTYTKNLITNLLKIDKENRYTFIHEKENPFFNELNHHIVPRKNFPAAGSYRKFYQIPKLIKQLKPDMVIETCHIGPFHTPKNCKKVTIIHDLTPILFPHFHINRSSFIHKLFLKKIINNADLIITPSENSKQDILKYQATKAEIAVIAPGVKQQLKEDNAFTKFIKTGRPPHTIKNHNRERYFLYLGTIEPRKNLEMLIESFAELDLPDHKLVFAGEIGWKSEQIIKKANETRNVKLTGFIEEADKEKLYKNAEIFIYPSTYEGFGLPPLEAMSYGTPVICSNGGSLQELYQNQALIFDPSDKDTLKNHIKTLLYDQKLYKELSANGKKYARNFTWQKAAQKTLEALLKIATNTN